MFFNERLMCRGGRVHEAWVCACARVGVGGAGGTVRVNYARRPVHDVCVDIKRWIGSRSGNPRRRLSLRTSVTLVAGVANTYRLQVYDLYADALDLIDQLKSRRRRSYDPWTGSFLGDASSASDVGRCATADGFRASETSMDTSSNNRTSHRRQVATPEQMMQRISDKFWPDISNIRASSEIIVDPEKPWGHEMIDISKTRHSNVLEMNIKPEGNSTVTTSNEGTSNVSYVYGGFSNGNYHDDVEEEEEGESSESATGNSTAKRLKKSTKSKSTKSKSTQSKSTQSKSTKLKSALICSKGNCCDDDSIPDEDERLVETINTAAQTDARSERDWMGNSRKRKTNSVSESGSHSDQSLDDLPLGITFVYKTRQDRIPTKLIFASLNPKVLKELESNHSE